MTIDMTRFYQVFFDETAEHLANMEKLLLAVDPAAPVADDLNAIFRAAHSIKGGAGTFGFSDMTQITHVLETLLDRVRKGELQLDAPMVDAFLQAGDVIKAQLGAHRGEGQADESRAAEVLSRLERLAAPCPAATAEKAPVPAAPVSNPVTYEIAFRAKCSRPALETLFENLRALGTLETVAEPKARKGDRKPLRCKLRLTTAEPESRVRELFEFVAAADQVEISGRRPGKPADAGPGQPAQASADSSYGFFENAAGAPAPGQDQAPDPGYGFFTEIATPSLAPAQPAQTSHGRRATDDPAVVSAVAGRRTTDKVVVAPQGESSSIRVGVEKVDTLINLVGELVITQAMLAQAASQLDPVLNEKLLNGMAQLDRNTHDLQEAVMSIRMMPISFVFSRFPRVVRDVAGKLGKQVELKTEGEATELDKGVIEKLADPLTHLVRNSLDHGIELPAQRLAAGKPEKGVITLRAFHQGGNIMVEVSDDGAGLDRAKLLAKARERGLQASDAMSDQEVFQLIFEAGFSTAETVTDVSGRGVGMDVVRRNVREMGGHVEIDSRLGQGTSISIRLPLTLAILDGLSVAVGGEMFIIPLTHITESLQPAAEQVKTVGGRGRMVHVRGDYLPVLALHELFGLQPKVREFGKGIMVILDAEGAKTALFVDELIGQHQVVIKSLESNYRRVPYVSGATIMGDGKVALILDAAALVGYGQRRLARVA